MDPKPKSDRRLAVIRHFMLTIAKLIRDDHPPGDEAVAVYDAVFPRGISNRELVEICDHCLRNFGGFSRYPMPLEIKQLVDEHAEMREAQKLEQRVREAEVLPDDDQDDLRRQASSRFAELLSDFCKGKITAEQMRLRSLELELSSPEDPKTRCARCDDTGLIAVFGYLKNKSKPAVLKPASTSRAKGESGSPAVIVLRAALVPNSPTWKYPYDQQPFDLPAEGVTRMVGRCSCQVGLSQPISIPLVRDDDPEEAA